MLEKGRTMGDSQAPPVASWCQMIPTPAPFLSPFLFQMGRPRSKMNGRTEIPTSPSPRTKFKPSGLQSHWTRSLLPGASLSVSFFTLLFTLIKATLPPTFKIDPGSYVASVGSTIAPTRVLNFPSDSKKKGRPSRPLDYCLGKPEISGAPKPPSSPLRVTTARKHPQHHFQHFNTFPQRNTTYLFRIVHSGIFLLSTLLPLSRSTVRPASASLWPLLCSPPGGPGPWESVVQPRRIYHRADVSESVRSMRGTGTE